MRHIRAGFAFEDDAGGFEGLEFVPDAFGDVYTVDAVFLAEDYAVDNGAVVTIGCRTHFASEYQNDSSLSGCLWIGMSVPGSTALSIR